MAAQLPVPGVSAIVSAMGRIGGSGRGRQIARGWRIFNEGGNLMERRVPTQEEVRAYLKENRTWGRWGPDDQVGAVNLITPEKIIAAARLVRSGRAVSMCRGVPQDPGPGEPYSSPPLHEEEHGEAECWRCHRLLWHLLPRRRYHSPGCTVPRVGRRRDVEWPGPG